MVSCNGQEKERRKGSQRSREVDEVMFCSGDDFVRFRKMPRAAAWTAVISESDGSVC